MLNKGTVLFFSLTVLVVEAFVAPYDLADSLTRFASHSVSSRHAAVSRNDHHRPITLSLQATTSPSDNTQLNNNLQLKSYNYDGYKLTYMYKPSSPKYGKASPMLLIHPIGIGMSSWFWERLLDQEGPEMYAVDLIGCGLAHGADSWDPNKRGMSVPLAWVKAYEALMQEQVLSQSSSSCRYTVVVQGGLAPVGVLLTARNLGTVDNLVLTSPPTDLTTTEQELARNYGFFAGRWTAPLAFGLFETRGTIKFFSNLFLFDQSCDDAWLNQVAAETCPAARPPVQVFNSGFCQARSYEPELQAVKDSSSTQVLVLQGQGDKSRGPDRKTYYTQQLGDSCHVVTLPGKNVLPWESPQDTMRAILDFAQLP